ncbi:hypothetical protein ACFL2V_05780 [Pseudomonadota bacterium]
MQTKRPPEEIKERMKEALEFMEKLSTWHKQINELPISTLIKLNVRVQRLAGR